MKPYGLKRGYPAWEDTELGFSARTDKRRRKHRKKVRRSGRRVAKQVLKNTYQFS